MVNASGGGTCPHGNEAFKCLAVPHAESDASKNPTFTMSPDDRPDLQAGLKWCRNYHHLCLASIAGLGAAAVALIAACASTGGKQNALVPPINWSLALRRVPGNRVGGTPGAAFGPKLPLNASCFRDSPRQACVERAIREFEQPQLRLGQPQNRYMVQIRAEITCPAPTHGP